MIVLQSLIYIAVVLVVGLAMVMLIIGPARRSLAELVGLVIALGAGTAGTLLMWASMIGANPTRILILAIGFCAAALVALLGALRGMPRPLLPRFRRPVLKDLALLLPLVPMIAAILIVAVIALRFDLFEGDSVVIWGFKAKALFFQPLKPLPAAFTDPGLSFSHQDYPLLLPMLMAGAYSMVGGVIEPAGKLIFPMLFVAQALLAFSMVRRWVSTYAALVTTALLVCLPFAVLFSGVGNPDAALETFYLGALIYLLRWIELSRRADLILCALFCGFIATTKSEGMPIVLIHCLVIAGFILLCRNRLGAWMDLGAFLAIVLFIAGTSWIWRIGLPHTTDDYFSQFRFSIIIDNLGRLRLIVPSLASEAISFSRWGGFWLLVPFIAGIGYKAFRKSQTWILWTLLLLHLALYAFVYEITNWDVAKLLSVTGDRLMLHVAPAAMLLMALHWSALRPILSPSNEPQSSSI